MGVKKFVVYVDGGCYNNGTEDADGYGSYSIYLLKDPKPTAIVSPYSFLPNPDDRMHEIQIIGERINPMTLRHKPYLTLLHNIGFEIFPHDGKMSNNIAELVSFKNVVFKLRAKRYIEDGQVDPNVVIYMDSQLTINQYTGLWKVKDRILKEIHREFKYYLDQHDLSRSFSLGWIPNELMKEVLGH